MRPYAFVLAFMTSAALGSSHSKKTMMKNVTYNSFYGDPNESFYDVACSDGPNGLISTHNWTTLGEADHFPYIGGVFAVEEFDSDQCGTCWELEYDNNTINVLAIDTAPVGMDISQAAMDNLTNNNAVFLGRVLAKVSLVDVYACEQGGFKPRPPTHHG